MEAMKNDISELMTNQKHMLEAIKYLHEQIEDIFKKAKNGKTDKVDNIIESREMIDKLIVKNCDDILLIKKTKEENDVAIKHLERQIEKMDKEIELTKKSIDGQRYKTKKQVKPDNSDNSLECKLCVESFDRFVDLEHHIKTFHEKHTVFQCSQCEKGFVLKWRMKKHMRLHEETNIKHCHYYNNDKCCPYEELGCKFLHTVAEICQF